MARLVEADIMLSWNFASLGKIVVSSDRIWQMLKEYVDKIKKIKATPKSRLA